MFSRKKLQSL